LWLTDYIPTNDGPNHILAGYLSNHLDEPGRGYDHFLEPATPLTSQGFKTIFAALESLLPWQEALRWTLALTMIVWATGVLALVRAVRPERRWLGLIGIGTAFPWAFYMGLFEFWLGTGLGLHLLAHGLRRPTLGWRDLLVIGLGLALQAYTHLFTADLTVAMLFVIEIFRPADRPLVGRLARLAYVAVVPVLLTVGLAVGSQQAPLGSAGDGAREPVGEVSVVAVEVDNPFVHLTSGPLVYRLVPIVVVAAACLWLLLRLRRPQTSFQERAMGVGALLAALTALLVPTSLPQWQLFSPRFVPFALAFALPLLPIERVQRRGLEAIPLIYAAVGIALAASYNLGFEQRYGAPLRAALEADVQRSGRRLPLILADFECGFPACEAMVNLGHLFVLAQGGMTPYLFATRPEIDAVVYRQPPERLFPPEPGRFFSVLLELAGTAPEFPARDVQLTHAVWRAATI
jgi:hypothetical protein